MSWTNKYQYLYGAKERKHPVESFGTNENCFIRKEHRCGKFYGASKSCFIACPTDEEIEPGGGRFYDCDGYFFLIGDNCYFWTTTNEYDNTFAVYRRIGHDEPEINRSWSKKSYGNSVRCLKDN